MLFKKVSVGFSLLVFFILPPLKCQDKNVIDSLKSVLKKAQNDSVRALLMKDLISFSEDKEYTQSINAELRDLAFKKINNSGSPQSNLFFKKIYAFTTFIIGMEHEYRMQINEALKYYKECLNEYEAADDKEGVTDGLNSIANIYKQQGKIQEALDIYFKCLHHTRANSLQYQEAFCLNNIAMAYSDLNDQANSLTYSFKSLAIKRKMGDKKGISNSFNNIAGSYFGMKDFDLALIYQDSSLSLRKEIGYTLGVAMSLNNIGGVYKELKDFKKATEYYDQCHKISLKLGDPMAIYYSTGNLGNIYFFQNNLPKALEYYLVYKKLGLQTGYPENIGTAAHCVYKVYKMMGKYNLALENYELYIKMNDSIHNELNRKVMVRSQLKHEYETKAAADSVAHVKESLVKDAELARQNAEIKAKRNQQYALFGGLFAVCLFGIFMFNRYKVTQKQKGIIEVQKLEVESQKQLVEHKQKEILDSIHYARRIQLAHMPRLHLIGKTLHRLKKM